MSKERELLGWIIDAYDSSDGNEFLYALEEARTFLDTQKDERLTVGQIFMMANERAKITSGSSGPVTTPCDIDPFPSEET
jgi:hypothetical protein